MTMSEVWHDATPEGAEWEEQVSSAGNWRCRPRRSLSLSPEAVVNVEWQPGRAPRTRGARPSASAGEVLPYPWPDEANGD